VRERSRGPAGRLPDAIPTYRLETLARSSLAACTDEDQERASEAVHHYQEVLLRHLRAQLSLATTRAGPSTADLALARDLLQRTRRMVLATVLDDGSARPEAEMVVVLTHLYCRELAQRRRRPPPEV
jgi:hypothetical protein